MHTYTLAALGVSNAIDAHIHPWRLTNLPPVIEAARSVRPDLAEDYSPARVIETATTSGFTSVIFVQARDSHEGNREEAQFFIEAAREYPQVAGCVVGINLLDPHDTEDFIAHIGNTSVVRACRMIAPENNGVGILSDPRAKITSKLLGEHRLRLDMLIRSSNPGQLHEAVKLVEWLASNSDTIVIGDHLLKPTGVAEGMPSVEWLASLRELAQYKNFYMKLSGLYGEVPPGSDCETFFPFYDAALEIFGSDRLLFGSDHPVSYSHAQSVEAVTRWISARGLSSTSIPQSLFADTARAAYGIAV